MKILLIRNIFLFSLQAMLSSIALSQPFQILIGDNNYGNSMTNIITTPGGFLTQGVLQVPGWTGLMSGLAGVDSSGNFLWSMFYESANQQSLFKSYYNCVVNYPS